MTTTIPRLDHGYRILPEDPASTLPKPAPLSILFPSWAIILLDKLDYGKSQPPSYGLWGFEWSGLCLTFWNVSHSSSLMWWALAMLVQPAKFVLLQGCCTCWSSSIVVACTLWTASSCCWLGLGTSVSSLTLSVKVILYLITLFIFTIMLNNRVPLPCWWACSIVYLVYYLPSLMGADTPWADTFAGIPSIWDSARPWWCSQNECFICWMNEWMNA